MKQILHVIHVCSRMFIPSVYILHNHNPDNDSKYFYLDHIIPNAVKELSHHCLSCPLSGKNRLKEFRSKFHLIYS